MLNPRVPCLHREPQAWKPQGCCVEILPPYSPTAEWASVAQQLHAHPFWPPLGQHPSLSLPVTAIMGLC